ncbi:MAG: hypothetical protein JWQ21_338 [Herminiimonas sp.]|jgi:hypothetical protein|nr:hypothetical protein [Herminiimonas sp.]
MALDKLQGKLAIVQKCMNGGCMPACQHWRGSLMRSLNWGIPRRMARAMRINPSARRTFLVIVQPLRGGLDRISGEGAL